MTAVYPFQVKVVNPAQREPKTSILTRGTRFTVYGMIHEHQIGGPFIIYFLVYVPNLHNFMLEPAWQFKPIE